MTFTPEQLDHFAAFRTIDITTYGRKTDLPRRIEIWWFRVDGRFIITGTPGRRDWIANVMHNPRVIVHVDGRDVESTATPILDWEFRKQVFTQPETSWYKTQQELDRLVRTAPMIEVHLGDIAPGPS